MAVRPQLGGSGVGYGDAILAALFRKILGAVRRLDQFVTTLTRGNAKRRRYVQLLSLYINRGRFDQSSDRRQLLKVIHAKIYAAR